MPKDKEINKYRNCIEINQPKIYYRVDTRLFLCGDEISAAGEYYDKFEESTKYIDDLLEENSPEDKKNRRNYLFLFEDKQCAKAYWTNMREGNLYEVSIGTNLIFHRGDIKQIDKMLDLLNCDAQRFLIQEGRNKAINSISKLEAEKISNAAKNYWSGNESNDPEIEVLVDNAIVIKIISTCEEERKCYAEKFRQKKYNIKTQEITPTMDFLNNIPTVRPQTAISAFLKKTKVNNKSKAMSNSVNASLKRNPTYLPEVFPPDNRRKTFIKEILKYSENYSELVSDENHIENIKRMCDYISKEHGDILINSRLNFGTVQKAFNLYLKFLWCLDPNKANPPHCPLDRIVLQNAGIHENWTELDCEDTYQKWIDTLKEKADNYDSLQHWELSIWNQNS